jgi:tetratricopeptide (TPR) repeat protein
VAENARIEDLRRRVQRDPASIAFAQLAEELRRAGRFDEAVDTCRAGLSIHPGYLSARVTLGRALLELNQLEAAQGELEHVLKSASENLAAIRGLGEIHHRRGELKEALAQFRAALALARNDPELEETVAQLAHQVEPQKAAVAADELSFDQMQSELLKLAPPPPVASAPPPQSVPSVASPALAPPEPTPLAWAPTPEQERAVRTVAALEQWLDAIHVARADQHA